MLHFFLAKNLLFSVTVIGLIYATCAKVSFKDVKLTISRTDGVFSSWNGTINEDGVPSLGVTISESVTDDVWVYSITFYKDLVIAEFNGTVCDLIENQSYAFSKDLHDAAERGGTPLSDDCPITPGSYDFHEIDLGAIPEIAEGRMVSHVKVYDQAGDYMKMDLIFSIDSIDRVNV